MSIGMEPFVTIDHSVQSHGNVAWRNPTFPYRLQCRACSFEPADVLEAPPRCPKCAGSAWERFAMPRSLLMYADQAAADVAAPKFAQLYSLSLS